MAAWKKDGLGLIGFGLAAGLLMLSGCATPDRYVSDVRMGMTADEVEYTMGQPQEVKTVEVDGEQLQVLAYRPPITSLAAMTEKVDRAYNVVLRDGKVVQWGEVGQGGGLSYENSISMSQPAKKVEHELLDPVENRPQRIIRYDPDGITKGLRYFSVGSSGPEAAVVHDLKDSGARSSFDVRKLPEIVRSEESVEERLDWGRDHFWIGKYDEAEDYFEGVLVEDPYNVEAMRYLKKVAELKRGVATRERSAWVEKKMTEVRSSWVPPITSDVLAQEPASLVTEMLNEIPLRYRSPDEVWVIQKFASAHPVDEAPLPRADLVVKDPKTQKLIPVPLDHTKVEAHISMFVAEVQVKQKYSNPYPSKIEATYVFPLPEDAAVTDFVMTIGDRTIRGLIREREQAKRIYEAAKKQGYATS
ncbi:MAG: VIT domain-containing protein, partial [Verrucomicrobiota bacterium]